MVLRQLCVEKPALNARETFIACTVAALQRGSVREEEVMTVVEYLMNNNTYDDDDDDGE